MFHARDGLFFKRDADGSVRIIKTDPRSQLPDAPAELDVTLDEGTWRSVIASVSRDGEVSGRWWLAGAFHNGVADDYDVVTGYARTDAAIRALRGATEAELAARSVASEWLVALLGEGYVSGASYRTWVHCDQLVLHRPGACELCDRCNAEAQRRRVKRGIPFSGEPGAPDALFRPDATIKRWGGNVPVQATEAGIA